VEPGEKLEKFLDSPLEKFVSPTEILSKMGEKKADAKTIKMLVERYGDKIEFWKLDLGKEKGIFAGFKEEEKKERDMIVEKILDSLTDPKRLFYKTRESWYYGPSVEVRRARLEEVAHAIHFLGNAVKAGIILPAYREKIELLRSALGEVSSYYSERVINDYRKELSQIEILISEKPAEITGKGLEVVDLKSGRVAYLDGELIGYVGNAQFSEKPTNGEVVAWVVSEVIDRDVVKGTQTQDTVYVWKKGWKEPKKIFEDHAWSMERYFRVLPPEVTEDGKVKIKEISGKETIEKEFEI
jgi:hypothetical protein